MSGTAHTQVGPGIPDPAVAGGPKPRLLDLFCGAGGAAMGYHRAGFEVIGVDIAPQPHYPFKFVQADAIAFLDLIIPGGTWDWIGAGAVDAVHASPPCRDHTRLTSRWGTAGSGWLLSATRDRLHALGKPWVIENVPGAEMRVDYRLCGCMFGLPGLRRDRWFETSWQGFDLRPPCSHSDATVTVAGHPGGTSTRDGAVGFGDTAAWKRAMGIDWMTAREMAQAIPPAYTEFIGGHLLAHLTTEADSRRVS